MNFKLIVQVFIIAVCVHPIQAQQTFNSKEDKSTAAYHINELKEGVLLVRLPSNRKKIEALENTLTDSLSQKDHKNVSKTLDRTLKETEEVQTGIIAAMGSVFTFSEYAFFMDYDTHEVLKDGSRLFQSDMKTTYKLKDSTSIYILSVGRTTETPIDAFIVFDKALQIIASPFPSQISRSGIAGLFGNDTSHIKRLNTKLWRYFNRVNE